MDKATIELYLAEEFCQSRYLIAQKLFLEGEKRRLENLSTHYHIFIRKFEKDFFDEFLTNIQCEHNTLALSDVSNIEQFFKKTRQFLTDLKVKLHRFANELMPTLGYYYAKILLCEYEHLREVVIYYNRKVAEGDKQGWSDAYIQRIMLEQQTAENVHDSEEKREYEL